MSEFNNSKWDATEWTIEQKIKWQEKCFELGYFWEFTGKNISHLDKEYYYLYNCQRSITQGLGISDSEYFSQHENEEKQYEDMFPVEKLVYISPESVEGYTAIILLGPKVAEEQFNLQGVTLESPTKPEHTQLLNQVFCSQGKVAPVPPETTTYVCTDYKLQIGDGLCLADLTGEQKSLLATDFDKLPTEVVKEYEPVVESKPTSQPEHIDTGFDGLVYVPPTENVYINLDTLSEEQRMWFIDNVPFDRGYGNKDLYLCYAADQDTPDWYYHDTLLPEEIEVPTTFNEVFKEIK